MTMRRTALMKASGPYKVESLMNGTLEIRPLWGQFEPYDEENDGGGPGVLSRMGLASDIERFLNGGKTYNEAAVADDPTDATLERHGLNPKAWRAE